MTDDSCWVETCWRLLLDKVLYCWERWGARISSRMVNLQELRIPGIRSRLPGSDRE